MKKTCKIELRQDPTKECLLDSFMEDLTDIFYSEILELAQNLKVPPAPLDKEHPHE